MRVDIQPARNRQPTDDHAQHDQQAASDELAALFKSHRNLPPEKQHEPRAQCKQQRMADRKPQRQTEGARVTRGSKRRRERQGRDRHQMIGAKAVKKAESEHRTAKHGVIIVGFGL